ncbi:hypothetical protein M9Y10_020677 [Tritrichomonas musculus]|uniref:Uncharacterized protein n=1 Tax=Tritrichomonas musculus TaxID=1915356 RepID=A0ABR2GYK5_9EUKA
MNDTLNGITNDIVKNNIFFNRLRENAYDEFKRYDYDKDKLDELMNYIRNTFVIQSSIDEDIEELKNIVWRIKHTLENITKIP